VLAEVFSLVFGGRWFWGLLCEEFCFSG